MNEGTDASRDLIAGIRALALSHARALAVAERRELQAAAIRGGFPVGETVNFTAVPVVLDNLLQVGQSGPVVMHHGAACVRWSATQPDALIELRPYLADRAELLLHPPEGS